MGANQSVEADGTTGWLASSSLAGCCASASRTDEEVDPFQTNHGNGRRRSITDEQPRSLRPLLLESSKSIPQPSTGQAMRRWVGRRQVESRTPGYPHLNMHSSKAKNGRLLISAPTDFRHIDGSGPLPSTTMPAPAERPVEVETIQVDTVQADTQPGPTLRRKPAFRPLQLSIYLPEQQLSPLPNFMRDSWDKKWNKKPGNLAFPGQAHVRNSSTVSEPGFMVPRKPIPSYVEGWFGDDGTDMGSIDIPLRPVVKRSSTMPMPERPKTINTDLYASERDTASPLPISGSSTPRMRSNTEPLNPPRSLRKKPSFRTPRDSVEDAISELNSIVEEARAKRLASNSPKLHHVPALAPNFKMHVRSETLSDIGSALSVPFSSKPLPSFPPSPVTESQPASAYDSPAMPSLSNSQTDLLIRFPPPPAQPSINPSNIGKSRLASFMQRRRNNGSVDTLRTYTSSRLTHSRTATDDTLSSFASSITVTSANGFYHGPSVAALQSDMSLGPYASPSLASTAATCPTNSTLSLSDTISTVRGGVYEEYEDEGPDTRSSTPDTTINTTVAPRQEGMNTRTLSVPSFGVAMELRERQGKSWNAVVEELDDKQIESGEGFPNPPEYVELEFEEVRGRPRYSAVGLAY